MKIKIEQRQRGQWEDVTLEELAGFHPGTVQEPALRPPW